MKTLLQRIKEFSPGYTLEQLQALLSDTPYLTGQEMWFIYPTYTQPDLTDPHVVVTVATGALPGWMNRATPDGTSRQILEEGVVTDGPNHSWSDIRKGPYKTDKNWTTESGTMSWQPGTGFNQNLGNLSVKRNLSVIFTAMP
jgi:hypothetical protein